LQVGKSIAVITLLLLASAAWGQHGGGRRGPPPPPPPPPQRQPQGPQVQIPSGPPAGQPQPHGFSRHGPGPHFGDWLRNHQDLSPADRLRALEQDPGFRNLPTQVQDRMRHRLQDFNDRTPEQQQQILQRMATFEHLTPEQQQKVRSMFHAFHGLPAERRQAVNQAFRQLQEMPPEQRQRALDSQAFRSNFSNQERELMRGMSGLGLGPVGPRRMAPPPGPPQ